MKKIILLLITILLLSACASSQTETPPTVTSVPTTPTPNPYAEDAFIAFCDSANEYDIERAQQLFTEDINIILTGDTVYEGLSGVEGFLNVFIEKKMGNCEVKKFEVKGDKVKLIWTHSWEEYDGSTVKAIGTCNATMQGDKIHKVTYYFDFIVTE
jgi:hypothetical protein